MEPEIITQSEVSKRLGVDQGTIRHWRKRGYLKTVDKRDERHPGAFFFDWQQVLAAVLEHDLKVSLVAISQIGESSNVQ